jgi:hypothetical protein
MRTFLSIIGPLIGVFGFLPYLKATIKGSVRPRIASWTSWSLVTGIATIAELSQHAYTSAFLTGVFTVIELSVLIAALKKGDYNYNWVDGTSQAISIIGIVAWLSTSDATWAIIFNIIADFFGAVPTYYHSWVKPHDESWLPYILSGVGAAVSLLAVKGLGFITAGFPIYLTFVGLTLGLNIYLRQKVVLKKS